MKPLARVPSCPFGFLTVTSTVPVPPGRDEKIIEFFDTARDAFVAGHKLCPDGIFSIQEVVETSADLGFYSHAVP